MQIVSLSAKLAQGVIMVKVPITTAADDIISFFFSRIFSWVALTLGFNNY